MSGEKCGSVSVDYTTLAHTEEADAKELDRLEGERERGEQLSDAREQRLEDLKKRVSRRRQREDAHRRRQAQRAEQARQKEIEAYRRRREQLKEAMAAGSKLTSQYPGIALPPPPAVGDPDTSSIEAIRAASAELDRIAREYQRQLNRAWVSYQQEQAIQNARAETRAWAMSFRAGAVRSAADVIAGLGAEPLRADEQRRHTLLREMAEKAKEMLQQAFPNEGAMELSSELLAALDNVLEAKEASDGQLALAALQQRIAEEQHRQAETQLEEQGREQAEREVEQRENTQRVAEQVAAVLEDLGYTVSGMEETAFVSNGHLYASRESSPDHVLCFEFDFQSDQIRSVPLRVQQEGAAPAAADEKTMRSEDAEFDRAWCCRDGLGSFRRTAEDRGVKLEFRAENRPGTRPLGLVAEGELGETLREARKVSRRKKRAEPGLRTRNIP